MNTQPNIQEVWRAALIRHEDGYGAPPDFSDPADIFGFYLILREGIRAEIEQEFVEFFRELTRRVNALDTDRTPAGEARDA